jgi:hypothetical protein
LEECARHGGRCGAEWDRGAPRRAAVRRSGAGTRCSEAVRSWGLLLVGILSRGRDGGERV